MQRAQGARNVGAGLRSAHGSQPGPYHNGLSVHHSWHLMASLECVTSLACCVHASRCLTATVMSCAGALVPRKVSFCPSVSHDRHPDTLRFGYITLRNHPSHTEHKTFKFALSNDRFATGHKCPMHLARVAFPVVSWYYSRIGWYVCVYLARGMPSLAAAAARTPCGSREVLSW